MQYPNAEHIRVLYIFKQILQILKVALDKWKLPFITTRGGCGSIQGSAHPAGPRRWR